MHDTARMEKWPCGGSRLPDRVPGYTTNTRPRTTEHIYPGYAGTARNTVADSVYPTYSTCMHFYPATDSGCKAVLASRGDRTKPAILPLLREIGGYLSKIKPRQIPESFSYVPGGTFRRLPARQGSLAAGTRGEHISHFAASAHPRADYRLLQGMTDQKTFPGKKES